MMSCANLVSNQSCYILLILFAMLIYCTQPNTWYLCLPKVSTIMLQFVFYHIAWNMVCESEGLVLHILDVIYILGVPILKVRMLCYVHLTCQRTEIFLVCMWRHGGHVGGTLTKECLLASIVLGTNMAAMSLYFESPGIDCKPSIANLYTVVWTDRNCREIKRTFSSKCNGSHEFDFAFYYVFQPLLPNSCFPWPAKKKKNHIHVYIFIFTSGSSAFWGHPRCGLSIWLSLLAIFNALFWVYAIFCMSRRNKTQIYLKAANILEVTDRRHAVLSP